MYRIRNSETSRNILRIGPPTFLKLCNMLEREGAYDLQDGQVWNNVAKSIYILTHNDKNRKVNF